MFNYYLFASDLTKIVREFHKDLEELRNAHVFITGGTGIIGKWILAALLYADDCINLGITLSVLTRNQADFCRNFPLIALDKRVTLMEGDIKNFKLDFFADFFIHGAADVVKTPSGTEIYISNVLGTQNALTQATAANVRRFLYLSSGAVYGKTSMSEAGISEGDLGTIDFTQNRSAYAIGKCGGEFLVNSFADEYPISVSSARCFAMAGPHLPLDKHFAFGNFMLSAIRGEDIRINGDGQALRSYLYLADVCGWLLRILIKGENQRVYNVGSSESLSIFELAEIIKKSLNMRGEVIVENNVVKKAHSDYYFPNTNLARSALDLSETYSVQHIVTSTYNWHKQNGVG